MQIIIKIKKQLTYVKFRDVQINKILLIFPDGHKTIECETCMRRWPDSTTTPIRHITWETISIKGQTCSPCSNKQELTQ